MSQTFQLAVQTGTSNVTWPPVKGSLMLTDEELAALWWSLYLAYGNDMPAPGLWGKVERASGAQWQEIQARGSDMGRETPPNDHTAAARGADVLARLTGLEYLPYAHGRSELDRCSLEFAAQCVLDAAYNQQERQA